MQQAERTHDVAGDRRNFGSGQPARAEVVVELRRLARGKLCTQRVCAQMLARTLLDHDVHVTLSRELLAMEGSYIGMAK